MPQAAATAVIATPKKTVSQAGSVLSVGCIR